MTWVNNLSIHAKVWDAGPYLPGNGVPPHCPHHSLLASDCIDIDYVVVDGSHSPATFDYSQGRFDPYIYTYDNGGGGMAFEPYYAQDKPANVPTTPHLYVVFYGASSDPTTYTPSVTDGMSLVPPSYCTGGLAADPVAPANDNFANAVTLPSTRNGSFDLPANMEWATTEVQEYDQAALHFRFPWSGCGVWYKFTPPVSGDYVFTSSFAGTNNDNPGAFMYAYRETAHPGEYPSLYGAPWQGGSGADPNTVTRLTGLVHGETIWLQIDAAEHYAAHFDWVGPAEPVWVDNNSMHAKVALLGDYLDTVFPPRLFPGDPSTFPLDAAEIDIFVTGRLSSGAVIPPATLYRYNANGTGGYVPTGSNYAYWDGTPGASNLRRGGDDSDAPGDALPPVPQVYVVWYPPNYTWPWTGAPSLTPDQCLPAGTAAGGTGPAYDPPSNDAFASRTVLTGASGSITQSVKDAIWEDLEWEGYYNNDAAIAWLEWTAPDSGLVTFTSSHDSPYNDFGSDLTLTVFNALGSGATPSIYPNSGYMNIYTGRSPNPENVLSFTAVAGTTYYFSVEYGDAMSGTLEWVYPVPPSNDNYADRITLTGDTGTATIDLSYATVETGEPSYYGPSKTAWYAWTPVADVDIRWSIDRWNGSSRHRIRVFTDTGAMPTDADELLSTGAGTGHFAATGGVTYIIRVELATLGYGPTDFHWLPYAPLSANIDWPSAIVLTGGSGEADFDLSDHPGYSLTYRYTPAADTLLWFAYDRHFEPNYSSGVDDQFNYGITVYADTSSSVAQDHWSTDSAGNKTYELKGGHSYAIAVAPYSAYAGRLFWGSPAPTVGGWNTFATAPNYGTAYRIFATPSLVGLSLEAGESSPGAGTTAWLRWTCPISGNYELAVREPGWQGSPTFYGHGPSRALVARVGTGASAAVFSPIATATSTLIDTALDTPSVLNRIGVTFAATAGTTYYVQVDAVDSGGAAIAGVVIRPLGSPPANDSITAPLDLTGAAGSTGPLDLLNATLGSGEVLPYPQSTYTDPDDPNSTGVTWYRFVGPADFNADTQGSTVFTFTDAVYGELTGWSIWIESPARVAAGYTFPNDIIKVGQYSEKTKFRPVAGQVYLIALANRDARAVTASWQPGTYYTRGPWIDRGVSTYNPNSDQGGSGRIASWDEDQSFYDFHNGVFGYTNAFARDCAYSHASQGHDGNFSEFSNGTAGMGTICYPVVPNIGHDDGYRRTGLDESWDEGAFFLPAFYTATVCQARWTFDLYNALFGPPAPPTPPAGSIDQIEGVRHYSDEFTYDSFDPGEISLYTVQQFDVHAESFAVRADVGWTFELRNATGISTDFVQPGAQSSIPLVHTEAIAAGTPGVNVADFTFDLTIASPALVIGSDGHPKMTFMGTSDVGRSQPAAVRALSDHSQQEIAYFAMYLRNVLRKPPRYRVLTPVLPSSDLTADPGDVLVRYVPVHQ